MRLIGHKLIVVATLLMSVSGALSAGSINEMKAAKIKAGIVYHVARLAEWPTNKFANAESPIVVGVLGKDPHGFGKYFEAQAETLSTKGRSIVVSRLKYKESETDRIDPLLAEEMRQCHILFVTRHETRHLNEILGVVRNASVLTIGESVKLLDAGGAIALAFRKGMLTIRVDLNALEREHVKIGAAFLQHADIVEGPKE
jgi:YfiR/HmsC-like